MPQCKKCKDFLSPDFFGEKEICTFCVRDTQTLYYGQFKEKSYTKKEAIEDYKKFLAEIANAPNIKEILDKTDTEDYLIIK